MEVVDRRVQGERTDLHKLRIEIENGLSQRELLQTYEVSSSQLKVVDRHYTYLEPNKREKPKVYWYYGYTGSGKSLKASQFNDISWKDDTKWWCGYDKH